MFQFKYQDLDISHKLDYASSPNDEYGKHMHYFYEIVYLINGDVDYTVESETRHLNKGDLVFVQPGEFHFATVNKSVHYERFVLKFPDQIIDLELKKRLQKASHFISKDEVFSKIFSDIDKDYSDFDDYSFSLITRSKIIEMLVSISATQKVERKEEDSTVIASIINYINNHISSSLSLGVISQALNYSESYIANTFKKNMKAPLMQYIRSKKIIAAREMILRGQKPKDIAESLGFSDYSTFYRSYIKIIGIPPSSTNSDKHIK